MTPQLDYPPATVRALSALDDLLIRISVLLQLTRTQHKNAVDHYEAVSGWLAADTSPISSLFPVIFPQGSLRIGTTVRPWLQEEYDLDLVLWLALTGYADPVQVLNVVEHRLRDHGTYAPMVERKNRCIRLNFAGQFHLDVLPARPDPLMGGTCVLVPDCSLHDWKASNPKGYALWFEGRASLGKRLVEMRAAAAEPLPLPEEAWEKTPLQLVVQLLKRWRDLRFADQPKMAPISIVLTTLAGEHYRGEAHPFEALKSIVTRINGAIPHSGRLVVCNPANPNEDLTERWENDPVAYAAFVRSMGRLDSELQTLSQTRGTAAITSLLELLFGETARTAVRHQVAALEQARSSSRLGVTSKVGTLTTAMTTGVVPVRRNTFYGSS